MFTSTVSFSPGRDDRHTEQPCETVRSGCEKESREGEGKHLKERATHPNPYSAAFANSTHSFTHAIRRHLPRAWHATPENASVEGLVPVLWSRPRSNRRDRDFSFHIKRCDKLGAPSTKPVYGPGTGERQKAHTAFLEECCQGWI